MGRSSQSHGEISQKNSWEKLGVSQRAYEDFERFWKEFESEFHGGRFTIPPIVVWLEGAPGAGKGTNSVFVREVFGISAEPVVTSDLLSGEDFKKIKDSGRLIDDYDVTKVVFNKILDRAYANGVLVDGYPRTPVQAECIFLLHNRLQKLHGKTNFQVVTLVIPESVSVQRQLSRGGKAKEHNARVAELGVGEPMVLRKTDTDPDAARLRYQVFKQQVSGTRAALQKHFPWHQINAEGSFEEVQNRIQLELASH